MADYVIPYRTTIGAPVTDVLEHDPDLCSGSTISGLVGAMVL
jgi:hypothetical protein